VLNAEYICAFRLRRALRDLNHGRGANIVSPYVLELVSGNIYLLSLRFGDLK